MLYRRARHRGNRWVQHPNSRFLMVRFHGVRVLLEIETFALEESHDKASATRRRLLPPDRPFACRCRCLRSGQRENRHHDGLSAVRGVRVPRQRPACDSARARFERLFRRVGFLQRRQRRQQQRRLQGGRRIQRVVLSPSNGQAAPVRRPQVRVRTHEQLVGLAAGRERIDHHLACVRGFFWRAVLAARPLQRLQLAGVRF